MFVVIVILVKSAVLLLKWLFTFVCNFEGGGDNNQGCRE